MMNGQDVYTVLVAKDIQRLYHANSVTTSGSFLRQGALLSRGYAEAHHFAQTAQYTDALDKRFGIWNDVFLDSDDYHHRISNRNMFGPVLFVVDSRVLTRLPNGTEVEVTRSNPTKWTNGQTHDQRYFASVAELQAGLGLGTFDQMITVRTPDHKLPFGQWLVEIVLDDPQGKRRDGTDAYDAARNELLQAACAGGVNAPLVARACNPGCGCVTTYQANQQRMQFYF